jgi:hypothetical protein
MLVEPNLVVDAQVVQRGVARVLVLGRVEVLRTRGIQRI